MAKQGFQKDNAGIRALLKSNECLDCMKHFAKQQSSNGKMKPFVGFDRAKVFVR